MVSMILTTYNIEICLCTVLIISFPLRSMLLTVSLNYIYSSKLEVYVNNKQGFLSQILNFRCSSLLLRETKRMQQCASYYLWGFEESAQEPAQFNMLTNYLEGVNKMNMSLAKDFNFYYLGYSSLKWTEDYLMILSGKMSRPKSLLRSALE